MVEHRSAGLQRLGEDQGARRSRRHGRPPGSRLPPATDGPQAARRVARGHRELGLAELDARRRVSADCDRAVGAIVPDLHVGGAEQARRALLVAGHCVEAAAAASARACSEASSELQLHPDGDVRAEGHDRHRHATAMVVSRVTRLASDRR